MTRVVAAAMEGKEGTSGTVELPLPCEFHTIVPNEFLDLLKKES